MASEEFPERKSDAMSKEINFSMLTQSHPLASQLELHRVDEVTEPDYSFSG